MCEQSITGAPEGIEWEEVTKAERNKERSDVKRTRRPAKKSASRGGIAEKIICWFSELFPILQVHRRGFQPSATPTADRNICAR